jgi:dinuclear metal center YbgI/SA1388 family protein
MIIQEITHYLESCAPLSLQESYDNSGLIVGDVTTEVKGVLIALDCTEEVINEAIAKKCNLIITHHPIVFSGLKKITGKNFVERILIQAIRNRLSIYAIHTNLDNLIDGVNKVMADKLKLVNRKVLLPSQNQLIKLEVYIPKTHFELVRNSLFEAGAGAIGKYADCSFSHDGLGSFTAQDGANPHIGKVGYLHLENEIKLEVVFESFRQAEILFAMRKTHPYEEIAYNLIPLSNQHSYIGAGIIGDLVEEIEFEKLLEIVKNQFKTSVIRYNDSRKKIIKKIAVCGGAGKFLLKSAIHQKADIFITSDFKYHDFFEPENHLSVLDIGHFESEQFTIELIADILKEKFTTFAILLTEINTNPVKYYI